MLNVTQRMSMQQKQSPQQVLLSTLLQLPILSLEQRIKMELETNPLLEEVQEEELEMEQSEPEMLMEQDSDEKIEDGSTEDDKEKEQEADSEVEEIKDEIDWDLILNGDEGSEFHLPRDHSAEVYEKQDVSPVTLSERLLEQLHCLPLNDKEVEIGEYIIWNLNEDGYLCCDVDMIARNLGVSEEEVEKILKVIQTFEPAGIAARDLRECLLIQLRERHGSPEAIAILENYFDDFKNKRFEKIAQKMNLSLKKVKQAMEEIASLNPKPGEGYISQEQNYIIPDVIVERVNGDFVVTLNESRVPHLRINQTYRHLLMDRKNTPKEVKEYIRKRLESARWLINSIHQRRITILRVMNAIVNRQREFFEKGIGHLKPMILKDIAEDVGMDISTISRVTNGKYVQTDFGVFELKYFFSEKMKTVDGEEISNRHIKDRIREIIENEDPRRPYNDQQIVELLKKEGVRIARRTVAKYREQMMIPVARLRRKI